jgi:bifunctional non-homologous end joining protein LigD
VWSSRQGGEVAQPGQKKHKRSKRAVDASSLPKAKAEKPPKFIEPMLSTAVERAPSSTDWVHEVKYDGYRVQVRIDNGKATLLTRKGLDWTERFTGVADAVAHLPVKSAIIDAEVVVQTDGGVASFTALVDALKAGTGNLMLYAFDLLHLDGFDLRATPLKDRKAALAKILAAHGDNSRIRYSDHIEGDGETVFHAAGRLGLEGIVSKRLSSPYQSGRSNNWVKIKNTEEGAFVIAGFVTSTASKRAVGALVLAEHVKGELVPSGHVGSGFSAADASSVWQTLDPIRTKSAPI